MIRLATAIRTMPAFWLTVPVCLFAGWYVTLLYASDSYAVDATAKATSVLGFIGPFCAASGAWEGSRLRRARLWDAPAVRTRLSIAFWPLVPIVLIGLLAVVTAIAVNLVRSDAGLPDPRFIAMSALDLAAYAAAGFAAGLLLPFAVAGPLAIATPFLWLGFVPAMYPLWLRHLTGMFRDCCGLEADLAWRAVAASGIVDLGILTAAAMAVARPIGPRMRLGGALGALGAAGAGGALLVAGMTYAPTVARDSALLECQTTDGVTVCTWPEHHDRADEVAGIAVSVRMRWQEAGMEVPSVFTEADASVAPDGALVFGINGALSNRDNIISSLASGMLPPFPDCPFGSTGGPALDYLHAWYDAAGGMSAAGWGRAWGHSGWSDGDPNYPPIPLIVHELQAASPEARRAWAARAELASQECDVWRSDLIAVQP
jgi:hypothetical protein